MVYTIGVADMKISSDNPDMLITYALGSCLGIAVYDLKLKWQVCCTACCRIPALTDRRPETPICMWIAG